MAEEEKKKKQKRPTAKKRDIQNERKRLRNKSFKSKTKTLIRSFKEFLKKKESPPKELLNKIFSLMDKGVKKKIFKKNKANRIKSKLSTAQIPEQKKS
jgi:small subunit ribosomal protein S20